MGPHTSAPGITGTEFSGQSDRRHGSRTSALFSLLYFGMDAGRLLIGDGLVTNFSPGGVGIRGNRSVTPGMKMVVDLPGVEEPLHIVQSRVSSELLVGSRHALRPRRRHLRP